MTSIITPDHRLNLSSTTMAPFITCPRRAFYAIVKQRASQGAAHALEAGIAVHKALEAFLRSKSTEECLVELSDLHNDPSLDWRTRDYASALIKAYIANYSGLAKLGLDDLSPITLDSGEPAVELALSTHICDVPFDDEVDGIYHKTISVWYHGVIDMLSKREDGIWVVDHKTSSALGDYYFDQFRNSQQQIGYCYLAQQFLGERVEGTIINALGWKKPTTKVSQQPFSFARSTIRYVPDRIDEWLDNTATIAADFLANLKRSFFPMHTDYCVMKFGKCEFFEVCQLPAGHRDMYVMSPIYRHNPPTTQAQRRAATT